MMALDICGIVPVKLNKFRIARHRTIEAEPGLDLQTDSHGVFPKQDVLLAAIASNIQINISTQRQRSTYTFAVTGTVWCATFRP